MAGARELRRNLKAIKKATKEVSQAISKAGVGAARAVRPFLVKEMKDVGARRDEHRPVPFGTYSKRFSSPADAESQLGHDARFVHFKTGDLSASVGTEAIKRGVKVGGVTAEFSLEGGYIKNPPAHLEQILGIDSLMFERQPFEALAEDKDFQNRLAKKYQNTFDSRLKI